MFSTEQFPNPLDYVIETNLVFLKAEHFVVVLSQQAV